jgi:hypothetical protein
MQALAQTIDWFPYLVQPAEWIVSALMLVVVACERFNTPPTNRSSTTFALFSFGLIFYYALIVALWLLVTIAVRQGAIGFDKSVIWLGGGQSKGASRNCAIRSPRRRARHRGGGAFSLGAAGR